MRNLLNFLIKYNYWFLFILLEVASFALLFRFNHYQEGVFFTSANVAVGKFYELTGNMTSYFHLKSANEELLDRNTMLEQQVMKLENALRDVMDSTELVSIKDVPSDEYEIFKARVINNSLTYANNYITLNKGASDGIKKEMGVISGTGVVGIVYMVSPSNSLVQSVLNSESSINAKIKGSDYFGSLKWKGEDSRHVYLENLPRHAEFNVGDTVVTSGYSAVFPEGIIIGTVDTVDDSNDGLSYLLRIRLTTDFGKLNNVRVISWKGQQEKRELESQIKR